MMIVNITDQLQIISTDAVNENIPAYISTTTYAIDNEVVNDNNVFKSLSDNNIGNECVQGVFWKRLRAVNTHACIDNFKHTQTIGVKNIQIQASNIDTLCLMNLTAEHLKITVKEQSTNDITYTYDESIVEDSEADWYEYFYDELYFSENSIHTIPYMTNAIIDIQFNNNVNVADIGYLACGLTKELGDTSVEVDMQPVKDEDFKIVNYSFTVYYDTKDVSKKLKMLQRYTQKPNVYIAKTNEDAFIVYGNAASASISHSASSKSAISLEVLSIK